MDSSSQNFKQWRPALFRRLAEVAARYKHNPEQHFWELGSWCFAVLTWLHERHLIGTPRRDIGPKVDKADLAKLLAWLQDVPQGTGPEMLWLKLTQVLEGLEQAPARGELRLISNQESTALQPLSGGSDDFFYGHIRHWIRPASALRKMREELWEARFGGKPMRYEPGPQSLLKTLAFYWQGRGVPVEPGVTVPKHGQVARIRREGEVMRLLEQGEFRLVLCPLRSTFHPLFVADLESETFVAQHAQPMKAGELLREHLERLVEQSHVRKAHLLFLPELTVDLNNREWLRLKLSQPSMEALSLENPALDFQKNAEASVAAVRSLMAFVPGSFHVPQSEGKPLNEAIIFDDLRAPLLTHHKRGDFRLQRKQVRPEFFPGLPAEGLPQEIQALYEGIEPGMTLQVLDVPLGRIVLLICADGLDVGQPLREQLRQLQPDLVCIIGMSAKCNVFWNLAEDLEKLEIGTLFVNAACVVEHGGDESDEELLAFVRFPWVFPDSAPPTHLRWRASSRRVEYYEHKKKKWTALSRGRKAKGEGAVAAAVSLWPEDMALEINLGAWWHAYQVQCVGR